MKIQQQKLWCLIGIMALLLHTYNLFSTTLVYSMKIRRAFNINALAPSEHSLTESAQQHATHMLPKTICLLTALPLFYIRDRHIVIPSLGQDIKEKLVALGAIFNFRAITPNYWWMELTTGLENQSVKATGTNMVNMAQTAFDDIIISAGKNFFFEKKGQIAPYIIAGFPLQYKVTPSEAQTTLVGSRFFGLGGGIEFSHAFVEKQDHSFVGILQTRFVHFFNRNWYPIFPRDARIQPGNITDIFVIFQYNKHMGSIEVGYNPTIFTDQAALFQSGIVRAPVTVRNSFYTNYTHIFRETFVLKAPGALGIGFNVSRSDLFKTKIYTGWINLSIMF